MRKSGADPRTLGMRGGLALWGCFRGFSQGLLLPGGSLRWDFCRVVLVGKSVVVGWVVLLGRYGACGDGGVVGCGCEAKVGLEGWVSCRSLVIVLYDGLGY